eukprot:EG_transcript_25513
MGRKSRLRSKLPCSQPLSAGASQGCDQRNEAQGRLPVLPSRTVTRLRQQIEEQKSDLSGSSTDSPTPPVHPAGQVYILWDFDQTYGWGKARTVAVYQAILERLLRDGFVATKAQPTATAYGTLDSLISVCLWSQPEPAFLKPTLPPSTALCQGIITDIRLDRNGAPFGHIRDTASGQRHFFHSQSVASNVALRPGLAVSFKLAPDPKDPGGNIAIHVNVDAQPTSVLRRGTVKKWDAVKKFGFITEKGDLRDVYFR